VGFAYFAEGVEDGDLVGDLGGLADVVFDLDSGILGVALGRFLLGFD